MRKEIENKVPKNFTKKFLIFFFFEMFIFFVIFQTGKQLADIK